MSTKPATIFDHLAGITDKKRDWSKLSEADRKSFSPYIVNRWLSMNMELIEIVDMFQQYTIGELDTKHVYQLYHEILPKQRFFTKYIKGKSEDKFNKELIEIVASHYQVSRREAFEYIAMLQDSNPKAISELLRKYGKDEKEIKKLMKPA